MPDYDPLPLRLRVQRALTDRLRTITVANGYQHDLDSAVFRGRQRFGSGDPLPMLALLQAPQQDEPSQPTPGKHAYYRTMDLLLQGFAVEDHEHPTDPAEMLLADVMKCLGTIPGEISAARNMHWNGITELVVGPGICRPPDEEISSVAYFWLSMGVKFAENMKDPYAVPAA